MVTANTPPQFFTSYYKILVTSDDFQRTVYGHTWLECTANYRERDFPVNYNSPSPWTRFLLVCFKIGKKYSTQSWCWSVNWKPHWNYACIYYPECFRWQPIRIESKNAFCRATNKSTVHKFLKNSRILEHNQWRHYADIPPPRETKEIERCLHAGYTHGNFWQIHRKWK